MHDPFSSRTRPEFGLGEDSNFVLAQWRSGHRIHNLPSVHDLKTLITTPLSEDEKVPITSKRMSELICATCGPEDASLLFREGYESAPLDRIYFAVLDDPPSDGTEASLHSFWDDNVRKVLDLLVPDGESVRNSTNDVCTSGLRPDYAFSVNALCALRGEEANTDGSISDAKANLAEKFEWAYDPAPYVFGYYCAGPNLNLVAITPPPRCGLPPVIHDLAHANLAHRRDRIRHICHLINLAGLFPTLAGMVQAPRSEFEPHNMGDCTVELAGHHIIKAYDCPESAERVRKLEDIYKLLQTKAVPDTDHLEYASENKLILLPRGVDNMPKTERELVDAIVCVLEALVVLHREPVLYHRDIRWHNVIRRLDDPSKWFLIDWEYASTAPTEAALGLSKTEHSPRSFSDGHGGEVDLWGVGLLILGSGVVGQSTDSELWCLGEWMQSNNHVLSATARGPKRERL